MTKWPDRPHAAFTGTYLGDDAHGRWVGARAGTTCRRAGNRFPARSDWVTLLSAGWWRAGFYDPADTTATYVDITTPAHWTGASVTSVDLDLDVLGQVDGRVLVDDEDEFAENQEALSYPADVVAAAEDACRWARSALLAGAPPFDGSHLPWLDALRERVPA